MTQRPNYDAWHQEPEAPADVEEIPASEHDLWGMTTESSTRRSDHGANSTGRPDWVAPVLVIVAAVLALALAWFVTRHARGDDSTSAPTMPATIAQSPTSEASSSSSPATPSSSTETSATSTATSTSSNSSSSSSSSSPAADFPAGTVTTCGDGQGLPADVRIAAGSGTTCAYVNAARGEVLAKVSADDGATAFTVAPYSESLHRVIPLSCQRANHLTQCSGGTSVKMWVRDAS